MPPSGPLSGGHKPGSLACLSGHRLDASSEIAWTKTLISGGIRARHAVHWRPLPRSTGGEGACALD